MCVSLVLMMNFSTHLAIVTQVFFVFLCLQANAEKVPNLQVATACFSCSPSGLNALKLTPLL